ncbi:MAG TPA: hypothetical protein VGM06_01785 [Polyangiaceae bacterium]|jgi:hypothetical protein
MSATQSKTGTGQKPGWIWTYDAQAFGNSGVIYGGPSSLESIIVTNKAASGTLYVQFFDAASVPSNSAVPTFAPIIVPAASTVRIVLNDVGREGYDGIAAVTGWCWAASTTAGTLTVDATSSVWVTARYVS